MRNNKFLINKCGLSFQLDKSTLTAKIIGSSNNDGDIIIPRSITDGSYEYIIKSISQDSFKNNKIIKSIQFQEDSQLQIIEKNAFFRSSIESLSIPATVEELQSGWCSHTWNLTTIILTKNNKNFSYLDKERKIIVGKTATSSEKYDIIQFACRDVLNVVIPSSIKLIDSFSFAECRNLSKIEFTENSELLTIGEEAFARSSISSISIPPKLIELGDGWCGYTHFLNEVSISKKNKKFSFLDKEHQVIVTKSKPKKKNCDILVFACRNIPRIIIPSTIKHIRSFAFCGCRYLDSIEFFKDSKLRTIGREAFSCSLIERMTIPCHVKHILERTFYGCDNLYSIEFSGDSELISISKQAFSNSSIESISIPSNVEELEDGWCGGTQKLTKVAISKKNKHFKFIDNEMKLLAGKSRPNKNSFDVLKFACRDITTAIVPASIKYISPSAFYGCSSLEKVEFPNDSKLCSIGDEAFSFSEIKEIMIPPHATQIGEHALSFCQNLKKVEFSEDSEIRAFEKESFFSSSIETISIPSNVEVLREGWCRKTPQLVNVKISTKNKYFKFSDDNNKIIVDNKNEIIHFACRDIIHAFISPSIKRISSFAFSDCMKIHSIEFSEDSQLNSIGEDAFSFSSIEYITIPKTVEVIRKNCFAYCQNLNTIEFSENSKLNTIEENAFYRSSIKSLSIPSNVFLIDEGWCCCTQNLINISISEKNTNFGFLDKEHKIIVNKSDKNSEIFDTIVFACRDIKQVKIPFSIKRITSHAFSECEDLNSIEFSDESELLSIGKDAFSFTSIEKMQIPSKVKQIHLYAFQGCKNLRSVELLSEELIIDCSCFSKCSCLSVASFPNVNKLTINGDAILFIPKDFALFVSAGVKLK